MHTDLDQYWKIVQKMFKDQLQTKLILTAYRFNFFVGYRRSAVLLSRPDIRAFVENCPG